MAAKNFVLKGSRDHRHRKYSRTVEDQAPRLIKIQQGNAKVIPRILVWPNFPARALTMTFSAYFCQIKEPIM